MDLFDKDNLLPLLIQLFIESVACYNDNTETKNSIIRSRLLNKHLTIILWQF